MCERDTGFIADPYQFISTEKFAHRERVTPHGAAEMSASRFSQSSISIGFTRHVNKATHVQDPPLLRCLKEFVMSAFLQFAGAVAITDSTAGTATTIANFAVSYSFIQFVAQVASYGVVGNPGLVFTHMLLGEISPTEIAVALAVVGSQIAGGCAAMALVVELRGSVGAYIPTGTADWWSCLILDACFSFLLGYIHLKLVWTSPKGGPPLIDTPYSPLVTTAFTYVALVSLSPFTGAGINMVRSLAPTLVSWNMPYTVTASLLGQFVGYGLAGLSFLGCYGSTFVVQHQDA